MGVPLLAAAVLTPIPAVLVPAGLNVAVLVPPGSSEAEAAAIVAAADGALLRFGPTPNVVLAVSDRRGFTARLDRTGAWLVFDPAFSAGPHRRTVPPCERTRSTAAALLAHPARPSLASSAGPFVVLVC